MQNNAENKHPYRIDIYREFIQWYALPSFERQQTGIANQEEFAARHKVNKDTLTRWKRRHDFDQRVDNMQREWGSGKTSDVAWGIYHAALKGNAKSQAIWMKYFTKFDVKRGDKEEDKQVLITEEDIRFLIQDLPEWRQKRYWLFLDQLRYDAEFFLKPENKDVTEKQYKKQHSFGGL